MSIQIAVPNIIWKSEYNIGNLKIDKEHQKLFSLARKALALSKKNPKESIVELKIIITELYTYVKVHFSNEEAFMKEIQYPDLKNHKILHRNMLNMLNALLEEINNLEINIIEEKLYGFIQEYFIKHIILEDKKIHFWMTPLEELRKSFGWKNIYSVADERIDGEHKRLFDIAQEAFNTVEDDRRGYKIKEVVTSLFSYMRIHFEHEEDYMESIEYPALVAHKELHKNIIQNMNDFVKKLPHFNVELFEKELARLIDIALVQHIIQEDRKIIEYKNRS